MEAPFTGLLIVVVAAVTAPLVVDLVPRVTIPAIVVEILAGIAIGPSLLGWVEVDVPIRVMSQIGLVFLFFLAGLEIAVDRMRGRTLRLAGAGYVLSLALAAVVALGLRSGGLVRTPLFIAIVLAATAFGIVAAVLKDSRQTATGFGQMVVAASSVADFGAVVLLSLFFSHQGSSVETTLVLLCLFALLIVVIGLGLARARMSARIATVVGRLEDTTAQITVRATILLLIAFVAFAQDLGLDLVLGAFMAGAIIAAVDHEDALRRSGLRAKLEGMGFGLFVPIFFVASGIELDLTALFQTTAALALVPLFLGALLVVRGLPALLYRQLFGDRLTVAAALLQATSLPFLVAAAHIGVQLGKIDTATGAALVAAGLLSVVMFPVAALALLQRDAPLAVPAEKSL